LRHGRFEDASGAVLHGEGVEEGLDERAVCGRLAVEVQHAVDVVVLVLEDARLVRLGVKGESEGRLGGL